MERTPGWRSCLYSSSQLVAVIDDMARRAAGLFSRGDSDARVAVIGILRRGAPLAERLVAAMVGRHGMAPPLRLDLKVKRYADDLSLLHPETLLLENAVDRELVAALAGCRLLVVDDVLYTGHSLLRAVAYLAQRQAAEIRVAVLVDRCVPCLPLHADIVGVRLQVAPTDIVECNVPPYEPEFQIEILQPAAAPLPHGQEKLIADAAIGGERG